MNEQVPSYLTRGSSIAPEEGSSTETTSALLKLMSMEEEIQVADFEENWSQSSGENLAILE